MPILKYKKGYKYQLDNYVKTKTEIAGYVIWTPYIDLNLNGDLIIKTGYAWDGPSGPSIPTDNFMRGSLVHDALYQLMRMEKLDLEWRDCADRLLREICREDGMSWIRSRWIYRGVNWFGKSAALPENKKHLFEINY